MAFTILEPSYYSQFACLAADCKRTCCQGWTIAFLKKDYEKLRSKHLPVAMREQLRLATRRIQSEGSPYYAEFKLDGDGKCPIICDGLCQLQKECGAEYLPKVCQEFPRTCCRVDTLLLRSCHNSCEAVHALFLKAEKGIALVRRPATAGEEHQGQRKATSLEWHPLGKHYEMILITLLAIMQNRAYSLGDRLLLVGMAVKELDNIVQECRVHEMTAWMMKYAAMATGDTCQEVLAQHTHNFELGIYNCVVSMTELTAGVPQSWLKEVIERLGIEISESAGDCEKSQIKLDFFRVEKQAEHLEALLAQYPLYMESILINQMISTFFPFDFSNQLYDSFLSLCNDYAAIRTSMIAFAGEDGGIQDIIDGAVYTARVLEHASARCKALVERFHDTGTDTLAHMAYLVHI